MEKAFEVLGKVNTMRLEVHMWIFASMQCQLYPRNPKTNSPHLIPQRESRDLVCINGFVPKIYIPGSWFRFSLISAHKNKLNTNSTQTQHWKIVVGLKKRHLRLKKRHLRLRNSTPDSRFGIYGSRNGTYGSRHGIYGIYGSRHGIYGSRYGIYGSRYGI